MAPSGALVIREKESLVLLNGSTESSTELVEVELLLRLIDTKGIAVRVQLGIAEEFEQRSVKLIATGFGSDQHGRTCTRAEFRRIGVSENFEFLDRINRRQN